VIADRDVAQDLRAGADDDIISNGRVPFASLLAGSPQCHALIKQHVIADFGSFTNDDAHSVIDETSPSDGRTGMDLDARDGSIKLRNNPRQQRESLKVHTVGCPMQQDGMKTGVTEENLKRALGGWIAVENRVDLFPDGPKHTTLF
jgi:hypothetical protein